MKDNAELNEYIEELYPDYEEENILILEPDVFAKGAVGLTLEGNVVYDYEKTCQALAEEYMESGDYEDADEAYTAAMEWVEYNTLRSLPYMESSGKAPIFINLFEEG